MSPTQQLADKSQRVPHFIARRYGRKLQREKRLNTRLRWQIIAIAMLLGAATFAVYSPVTSYPFINYVDPSYVVQNPHVRSGLSWQTVVWAVTATYSSNWHPLTWLSHALDCQLYGLDAGGHHFSNVLIHGLNVLLLFLLVWRATRAVAASALIAALFAVHPLNVGSVAWVAERKNLLSMFFFLFAVGAYGWYVQKPSWKRYGLVSLFFAMGLASHPMIITLPFVLFLLDYWPRTNGRFDSCPSGFARNAVALESAGVGEIAVAGALVGKCRDYHRGAKRRAIPGRAGAFAARLAS